MGYQTVEVTQSRFTALGIQFTDVAATDTTIAIKDLLKADIPYGRSTLDVAADQIHVWTGMAWNKYFYSSTLSTWVKDGESKATNDTVKNGDTVFFRRSARGNGTITLAGGVNVLSASLSCALTRSTFHFVCYPWPVDFAIDDFKNCVDVPFGRPSLDAAADQVHVWTGMSWDKYYYNSDLNGFVKDGEDEITKDKVPAGQGVFFRRSARGDGTLTFTRPEGL